MDVLVAGAGVVGMACARALQRAGYGVAVADPLLPGSACSSGNAGVVASDHVLPGAHPDVLRRLPAMLMGGRSPLSLKMRRVPALLPWAAHFAAACRAPRVARGIAATAALTGAAVPAWEEELKHSGAGHLLRRNGLLCVYFSDAGFRRDEGERRHQRDMGVAWQCLDADELRARQPALTPALRCGVFYPDVAHVVNPRHLIDSLVQAFTRDGGALVAGAVRAADSQSHQVVTRLDGRRMRSRYLVIAAGLGSRTLASALGVRLPLAAEMGYHVTWPGAETRLSVPVAAAEHGFIVTPMIGHLRAAGTVELAAREAAPDWARAQWLACRAARLFDAPLPAPADRWHGSRPTLPDYLPAIGPLPRHPRVMAACGHQHIGLTTAAVTGGLIRDLVRGERPSLDMAPYDPGRFTSPRA